MPINDQLQPETKPSSKMRIAWPDLFGEAIRNLTSGTSAAGVALLLFVLVIGGLGSWRAGEVAGISIAAQQFQLAGSSTYQLSAEKSIDPNRCLSLAGVGTIRETAALRSGPKLRFALLAGRSVATLEGVGEFGRLLHQAALNSHQIASAGAWISSDLARDLGLINAEGQRDPAPASQVALADGQILPVAGIFGSPSDGRQQSLGYTAILPVVPTGAFDSCWARIWPHSKEAMLQLRLAVDLAKFGGPRDEIRVDQLNSTRGQSFQPLAELKQTPSRYTPGIALVAGIFGGLAYVWRRRLEFASTLHAGLDRASLTWLVAVELTIWLVLAVGLSLPVTYWLAANRNPDPWLPAALAGVRVLALGAFGVLFGALGTVVTIRESSLFVFFKRR